MTVVNVPILLVVGGVSLVLLGGGAFMLVRRRSPWATRALTCDFG